jgi:hypothetical protein
LLTSRLAIPKTSMMAVDKSPSRNLRLFVPSLRDLG